MSGPNHDAPHPFKRGNGRIQLWRWKILIFYPPKVDCSWLHLKKGNLEGGENHRTLLSFCFRTSVNLFHQHFGFLARGWRLQDDVYRMPYLHPVLLFIPFFVSAFICSLAGTTFRTSSSNTTKLFSSQKKGGGDLTKWFQKQTAGDDVWSKGCLVVHVS